MASDSSSDNFSSDDQDALTALEIKNSLGGVSDKEQKTLFDLRKKKKLSQAVSGSKTKE